MARVLAGLFFLIGACANNPETTAPRMQSCVSGSDCPSRLCIPTGRGGLCSTQCSSGADCPPGWACDSFGGVSGQVCRCDATPETCDGEDQDCDGNIDEACCSGDACPETDASTPPVDAGVPPLVCIAPEADCNGLAADGCEANLDQDAANCGACGNACEGGAECLGGVCGPVTLMDNIAAPYAVAVSGQRVFVANARFMEPSGVRALSRDGGEPEWVFEGSVFDMQASGTFVYFVHSGDVYRVAESGGVPRLMMDLADVGQSISPINEFVVDRTGIYGAKNSGVFQSGASTYLPRGEMYKTGTGGGSPQTMGSELYYVTLLEADASALYFNYTDGMVLDFDEPYRTDVLMRLDKSGRNPPRAVVENVANLTGFAVAEDGWLYYSAADENTVYRVRGDGTSSPEPWIVDQPGLGETMVVDGDTLFYISEGDVKAWDLNAGVRTTMLRASVWRFAIDADYVYGLEYGESDGRLLRASR
ncbi:MAG: hypothetical protein AAGF12_40900 [Myxococcota bacterium]